MDDGIEPRPVETLDVPRVGAVLRAATPARCRGGWLMGPVPVSTMSMFGWLTSMQATARLQRCGRMRTTS